LSTNKLKNLEREIAKVQTVHPINRNIVKELELQKEYERIHEQVEIFWQQRSRVRWAQLGTVILNSFTHQQHNSGGKIEYS
jgi:hypothetical protein